MDQEEPCSRVDIVWIRQTQFGMSRKTKQSVRSAPKFTERRCQYEGSEAWPKAVHSGSSREPNRPATHRCIAGHFDGIVALGDSVVDQRSRA